MGGRNLPTDVCAVQDLLNAATSNLALLMMRPNRWEFPLLWSGEIDLLLIEHIRDFQTYTVGMAQPDGRIDPGGTTLRCLNEAVAGTLQMPGHIQGNPAYGRWAFLDIGRFVTLYWAEFGPAPPDLKVLAQAIKDDPVILDIRWAAYMLATAWWETGRTFRPLREYGRVPGTVMARSQRSPTPAA